MVFDFIDKINTYDVPHITTCCLYFDLECACYVIGGLTLFISIGVLNVDTSSLTSCFPGFEIKYIVMLSKVLNGNLFFMTLYFLYGVKKKRVVAIKVFLLMLSTFIIYYFVEIVILYFATYVAYDFCPVPKVFATTHFANIIVYLYFIIVVNSYLRSAYVPIVAVKDLRII